MSQKPQHPWMTLFAVPKAFHDHINVIQRNAIQSWKKMAPDCQIILLGSDEGTAEVAAEFGLHHIPDIATNEHGTPLVDDIFAKAEQAAASDILCYVNADIILMSDFADAVREVTQGTTKSLMVGRRWNVDLTEALDFEAPDAEEDLRTTVQSRGSLFTKAGIDYFVYTRGVLDAIPPFAIGRTAWDNWLIFRARQQGAAVIDATARVTAVHQDHDYGNFKTAKALWVSDEARRNQELMGSGYRTLDDVTHVLSADGLRSAWSPRELFRNPLRLTGRFPALRGPKRAASLFLRPWRAFR